MAISALAMFGAAVGCMRPAPVTTSDIELEVVNACTAGDASHTIAAAVTCAFSVSSSANDGAAITAGTPRKSCGKWVVDCYLSGIKCSGARTKKPLACTPPEYTATNQDVSCPATWARDLTGFQGTIEAADDASIVNQPSLERAAQLCASQYKDLLTDLNATANNMCNAVATKWTDESKKSAVCCIPAPKLDAGVKTRQSTTVCGAFGDAEYGGCGTDVPPDAGLPPGDGASGPGDAGSPPDDGATCSIEDPGLGDEPVPPGDE